MEGTATRQQKRSVCGREMTKEEFVKGITFLGLAYNKEFDQNQTAVWFTFFQKDSFGDFRNAVVRLITKCKYLPSIAEIRGEIAEIRSPELQKTSAEAWEDVESAMQKYGFYRSKEALESLDSVSRKVIRSMGGFAELCRSEEGDWMRRNFCKLYEDLQSQKRDALRVPYLTDNETLRLEAKE